MSEQQTGAADWRSETEKRKSLLRKSVIALFKTWIPDHPEASVARGEVFSTTRDAMSEFADSVTFVSLLSFGSEDMFAHDFLATPLSMQDLLVQREGTDAFLDAKNALRVVRRKFGMMTLIARMASTLEQRNIVAVKLRRGFDQDELIRFSKAMTVRVEGTAAEEEIEFKRRLRKAPCEHLDIIYHSELVGRRVPVPWPIKEIYSIIGRQYKKTRNVTPEFLSDIANGNANRLGAKILRQLSIHADQLTADLDAGGLNPFPVIIKAADERRMLTATRSIFDDFHEIRSMRRRERAEALIDGSGTDGAPSEATEATDEGTDEDNAAAVAGQVQAVDIDTDDDFVAAAEEAPEEDSEFLLLAQALDRIRTVLGKAFFHRISMVSGDVNFVDAARAGDADPSEMTSGQDPLAVLEQAREITEPFYRARGLANAVPGLLDADHREAAIEAAEDAIRSARSCQTEDNIAAYTCTFSALLATDRISTAADAVREVLSKAHLVANDATRSAAL
ncbi:MAG: hypothetical protein VX589_09260, partial [Myxococcota bacterium]|nr:hypothetical protein [Myxococcota bacterium]